MSDAAMFSQISVNITAAVILILLAVLQVKVEDVGHKVVKQTCHNTCRPSGYCYYSWSRNGRYVGCSYGRTVWFTFTSSSDQDTYSCDAYNNPYSFPKCKLDQNWGVTYITEHVCALKDSSVSLSCSYKYPEGLKVNKSFWFIKREGVEPEDVRDDEQYKGRVQYSQNRNNCSITISHLRERDAHTYRFRFFTDDPDGIYTFEPGVTVSVTATDDVFKTATKYAAFGLAVILPLMFIAGFLCMRRKRRAERSTDVQTPCSGDDTYAALNLNTMSSDYDTLTTPKSEDNTYTAVNLPPMSSDYETLTCHQK